MSLFDRATFILTPSGIKEGKLFSLKPTNGLGDYNWTRSSSAYEIDKNGLPQLVSANTPRITYINGVEKILIEEEKTNMVISSNSTIQSVNTACVITFNYADSPFGINRATHVKLGDTASSGPRLVNDAINITENTVYTYSFWAKNLIGSGTGRIEIHTNIGEVNRKTLALTDKWERHSITFTTQAGATSFGINNRILPLTNIGGEFLIDGMQLELGNKATSTIINNGTLNTRFADTPETINPISKGFLTSTEGTIIEDNKISRYNPDGSKEVFIGAIEQETIAETPSTSFTFTKSTERILMFDYALSDTELEAYIGEPLQHWVAPVYEQETLDYKTLVENDGGIIADIDYVDAFVAKCKEFGILSNLLHWTDTRAGIKKDANGFIEKTYSLFGIAHGVQTQQTKKPLYNEGIIFDGDDDALFLGNIQADSPLTLANGVGSIEAKLKPASGVIDDTMRVVDKSTEANFANGYGMYVKNTRAVFVQSGSSTNFSANSIPNDIYTDVLGTINGANSHIYFNGVLEATRELDAPANITADMRIGTWNHSTGREYKGGIGYLRIWDIALTVEQHSALIAL